MYFKKLFITEILQVKSGISFFFFFLPPWPHPVVLILTVQNNSSLFHSLECLTAA